MGQGLHCRPARCPDAAIADLLTFSFSCQCPNFGKDSVNVGRGCLHRLMLGVEGMVQEHRSGASGQWPHTQGLKGVTMQACVSVGLAAAAAATSSTPAGAWMQQSIESLRLLVTVATSGQCHDAPA